MGTKQWSPREDLATVSLKKKKFQHYNGSSEYRTMDPDIATHLLEKQIPPYNGKKKNPPKIS